MTIDEAIEYELSGGFIPPTKYMQTYREQIVEWLEELKVLREAVQCNAFTDGYKKDSMSMLKEVNRKIDELENSCKEEYGCEIIEMYVEVVLELKEWIKHLN